MSTDKVRGDIVQDVPLINYTRLSTGRRLSWPEHTDVSKIVYIEPVRICPATCTSPLDHAPRPAHSVYRVLGVAI